MSRRWLVVDTQIFCFTAYQKRDRQVEGGESTEFLQRIIDQCEEYGLALDREGLILEEYEREIPQDSFGRYAFQHMLTRIPNKVAFFEHKNSPWLEDLKGCDKHDRRFVATALATPDKVLVSEDSVFHQNAALLRREGVRLYDIEEANRAL